MNLTQNIKQKALEIGFDLVGICSAGPIPRDHIEHLQTWLQSGYAGQMNYMTRNFEKRTDPAQLMPGAKSVICTALAYEFSPTVAVPGLGRIASYAQNSDYHQVIKNMLFELAQCIESASGTALAFKACVDSVPLAERSLAATAGLGFIGKNHMLINPDLGTTLLLGELIVDLELEPDAPVENKCGTCHRCIENCPAKAIGRDGFIDCRKCVSYLTIEKKDAFDEADSKPIGSRIFGCDECIRACPFTKTIPCRLPKKLEVSYRLSDILQMQPSQFETVFADTALFRLGLDRLKRNAEIAQKNNPPF